MNVQITPATGGVCAGRGAYVPTGSVNTWDLVFVGPQGEPLAPWSVLIRFREILDAAGMA